MEIQGKSALAGHFEVSRTTVESWIRRGCPYLSGGDGEPWVFDDEDVEDWLERRSGVNLESKDPERDALRAFAGAVAVAAVMGLKEKLKLSISSDEAFEFVGELFKKDADLRDLMRAMTRKRN